ncbi:zinc finger MYM-type protein 1-like protein [Tanacetum coccineum]
MLIDVALKFLEGLVSYFENYRETGYENAISQAEQIAEPIGVEHEFPVKRTPCRKNILMRFRILKENNNLLKRILELMYPNLKECCLNLESALTNDKYCDIDGNDLFMELQILQDMLPSGAYEGERPWTSIQIIDARASMVKLALVTQRVEHVGWRVLLQSFNSGLYLYPTGVMQMANPILLNGRYGPGGVCEVPDDECNDISDDGDVLEDDDDDSDDDDDDDDSFEGDDDNSSGSARYPFWIGSPKGSDLISDCQSIMSSDEAGNEQKKGVAAKKWSVGGSARENKVNLAVGEGDHKRHLPGADDRESRDSNHSRVWSQQEYG